MIVGHPHRGRTNEQPAISNASVNAFDRCIWQLAFGTNEQALVSEIASDRRTMTASERPANQITSDATIAVPGHPGRWRLVSLAAVAFAVLVVTLSIVQDRRSADSAPPGEDALEFTDITVGGSIVTAAHLQTSAHGDSTATEIRAVDASSGIAMVPVSALGYALVTATTSDGAITGLAINDPANQTTTIDDLSTAQVLLTLSPALLLHDIDQASRSAARIVDDPMHDALVAAVASSQAITPANNELGASLAALLDRVPIPAPQPNQGCDSVSNSRAYPIAGTCVQPGNDTTTIENEQDRWVLVFGEQDDWSTICASVPPAHATNSSRTISSTDCTSRVLLTTPGELPDNNVQFEGVTGDVLAARHDAATALTLLDAYVLPYAALTAGIDGYTDRVAVASSSVPEIVRELSQLMASDQLALDAVRAAYDPASTPAARHRATAQAAYSMLSSDRVVAALPTEIGQREQALALLDFYRSTASYMTAQRSGPTWTAVAAGVIDDL